MASRLNLRPVLFGHWRGLTMRRYMPNGDVVSRPYVPARTLTLLVPAAAGVGCWLWLRGRNDTWSLPPEFAGAAIAAAALLSAGLVAAFAVLVGWRDRLTERDRARERALRAMVDEAVAHVLLATLESVLVVPAAALSMILHGGAARAATTLTWILSAHVIFLFVLLVPRLYSAYGQTNEIEEHVDGLSRP
jgi:hypothetical protein